MFETTKDTSNQNKSIPPAPSFSENDVKGYTSPGYWQLVKSLNPELREETLAELKTPEVISRANELGQELARNEYVRNDSTTRITFLAALLSLQRNTITVNQLATLHLLDSAIRTLYTSPLFYLRYTFFDKGSQKNTYQINPVSTNGLPSLVRKLKYDVLPLPNNEVTIGELPKRMQSPLIVRFFNFTDSEWDHFQNEIKDAPISEQSFHILTAPDEGCWSTMISSIQKLLKCMRVLDWYVATNNGISTETIMIIPSFSMFQAALNAKAKTLGRTAVNLVPTYYYINEDLYWNFKAVGSIPFTLYLPEKEQSFQYQMSKGMFRTTIDGHPCETAFGGAIHDVYHAFREMQMTESVALARMRLASIAKNHPNNQISPEYKSAHEVLIDGELIFSYGVTNIFSEDYVRESFGALFYTPYLKPNLHPNLKRAFIEDMVVNKEDWLECFNLGKKDLLSADQVIYDEIVVEVGSAVEAANTVCLLL